MKFTYEKSLKMCLKLGSFSNNRDYREKVKRNTNCRMLHSDKLLGSFPLFIGPFVRDQVFEFVDNFRCLFRHINCLCQAFVFSFKLQNNRETPVSHMVLKYADLKEIGAKQTIPCPSLILLCHNCKISGIPAEIIFFLTDS